MCVNLKKDSAPKSGADEVDNNLYLLTTGFFGWDAVD